MASSHTSVNSDVGNAHLALPGARERRFNFDEVKRGKAMTSNTWAVDSFNSALNAHDLDQLEACLLPDFEMIVPQKPGRGFRGRDQEIRNMRQLFEAYPDFRVTVLRQAVNGIEVWTETTAHARGLEMAAIVIWMIEPETGLIAGGRYYSERVEPAAPPIDDFISDLATASSSSGAMDDAAAVLSRYFDAQRDKDLESLVSCWHPDIEAVHPLRPDRSWKGLETYRRAWARIWESNPNSRFEVLSSEVVGNRIYLEALVEHADGTMVPNLNILEVQDGKIRRARVYTDVPVRDGLDMDGFVEDLNPNRAGPPGSSSGADLD
jgi:ketosteroid isomerase-like protein